MPLNSMMILAVFRDQEPLEYPDKLIRKGPEQKGDHLVDTRDIFETLPVDSTGYLQGTGEESLDGEVSGAIDLVERLSQSQRVRQSIIRHAFRYFMGRNERLSDSKRSLMQNRPISTAMAVLMRSLSRC